MSDTYITIRNAVLYNPNGKPRENVAVDTVLDCETWAWDSGPLTGMHKVNLLSGDPIDNRFIKDIDIKLYTDSPPPVEPPPDDGSVLVYPPGMVQLSIESGELAGTWQNVGEARFARADG